MSASWACESESEDEVQETNVQVNATPADEWTEETVITGFQNIEFGDKASGSSGIKVNKSRFAGESDSEEEQETETLNIEAVAPAPVAPKKVSMAPLSKKEKEALRQKDLDEFSAILEELGVTENTEAAAAAPAAESSTTSSDDKKKKKKAKKPASKKEEVATPTEEVTTPVNISEILKARTQSKGKKPTGSAQQSALAAAIEGTKDEKKKKKIDKSKFSEGTY